MIKIKNNFKILIVFFITFILLAFILIFFKNSKTITMVDYGSLECDDSMNFYIENGDLLLTYYNNSRLNYEFKPVDLESFDLDDEIYLRMKDEHLNFPSIVKIFKTQKEWNSLPTLDKIISKLNLNKTPLQNNKTHLENCMSEVDKNNLTDFPAIYINNKRIPYDIKKEELQSILDEALK